MKPGDTIQGLERDVEPRKALTGFLELPGVGRIRLDFLITRESGSLYIRCLDFGIMSCGETVEECKENILEAILIYLEDLPEGQGLFKPAPPQYWQMFYELRYSHEQRKARRLSRRDRHAIQRLLRASEKVALQYA
jgi:predicted RNase H-like HicB family nuclease